MCSFDTVIYPCPVLGDWVRTDQTRADCSREHRCESEQGCPVEKYFVSASFMSDEVSSRRHGLVNLLAGHV